MAIVSSTDGSATITGWKRRSRAGSFSMCLRYSSSVVAPTARSSPRASIGFSMLPASIAPSAAPAPTIVCSSSMKTMTWPAACLISSRTAFKRSSNSPRYLEPATIPLRSSAMTRLPWSDSGTSPPAIRWARPSTIAVLPTPGSPISTGLFFVRRLSTWITRRISSSRPMTGSSLPCSAVSVRSRAKRSSGLCSSSWAFGALGGATPLGGVIGTPSWRPAERRADVGRPHDLTAAVGDELGAEGAAHLLELLGQAHLRLQRLHLDLLDARVHALDLLLETEDALHAGQVEAEVGRHLLDAAQPLDVLLRVQAR